MTMGMGMPRKSKSNERIAASGLGLKNDGLGSTACHQLNRPRAVATKGAEPGADRSPRRPPGPGPQRRYAPLVATACG